jgi:amino acid permease
MNKTLLLIIDGIIVIALLVVAVVYWTHPANQLPHWFPGYSSTDSAVHIKHGLGAVIIALAVAAYGWFATGPKDVGSSNSMPKQ